MVKQGCIMSSILFLIYLDGLLCRLLQAGVGCWVWNVYAGGMAFQHLRQYCVCLWFEISLIVNTWSFLMRWNLNVYISLVMEVVMVIIDDRLVKLICGGIEMCFTVALHKDWHGYANRWLYQRQRSAYCSVIWE